MLLECVVYVAVFFVVLTLAFGAMHRTWLAHKALRRNADEIAAALHAGEQWRADVRRAVAPIQTAGGADGFALTIPCVGDSITYRFDADQVTRETAGRPARMVVLRNLKSSQMTPDPRQSVTAWRWELEFKSTRKTAKMRPLFTFTAVPGGAKE